MNYEKKYKEALEIARKINSGEGVAAPPDWTSYEVIFPELKESKDDRIVRCLLNYFNHVRLDLKGTDVDEVIAWLDKQDEKIHNMTYNPADKVEPKFKVGDWITNGDYIWKIVEVMPLDYILQSQDGNIVDDTISYVDEQFHSFTIEDAKAGDVLVYETDEVEWIFIYREIVPAASEVPHDLLRYYFLLEGNYFNWSGVSAMITDDYKLYLKPATKEQQDTLFAKMKEAGYEWDSDKKELKKMEAASKESEDERIKKTIIRILKGEIGYTSKEDIDKYVTWLEKQGKRLGADKVIAWLVANICDFEYYVTRFKKDFGLC